MLECTKRSFCILDRGTCLRTAKSMMDYVIVLMWMLDDYLVDRRNRIQIVWNKILVNIDVNSKYGINGFSYLGKDKKKGSSIPFEELVVLRLMEPFTK
uniref:Uncharacterized protein n=1 Tax=Vespula pensylvanica TaxID=30213 RepID=A0A834K1W5_VESPE|nr:hypothetical protein H0235_016328 [Vespula pensylvanica]